jgi:hypothetical protein
LNVSGFPLAFGINPPDLIVVAGDAPHTVGPASVNEIVERLIFGGERFGNRKQVYTCTPLIDPIAFWFWPGLGLVAVVASYPAQRPPRGFFFQFTTGSVGCHCRFN